MGEVNFTQFELRQQANLRPNDFLVGYKADGTKEFRTTVTSLTSFARGAQGLAGASGIQGFQGAPGNRGQIGLQGVQGVSGSVNDLNGVTTTIYTLSGDGVTQVQLNFVAGLLTTVTTV